MTLRLVLRTLAIAMAIAAVVDPGIDVTARTPVAVDLRSSSGALSGGDAASLDGAVLRRLRDALGSDVAINADATAAATVVVGGELEPDAAPMSGAIDFVVSAGPAGARLVSLDEPGPTLTGWAAPITGAVEGRGLAGQASTLVLERDGIEVDRAVVRWTKSDERLRFRFTYVPPSAGVSHLAVRVLLPAAQGDRREVRVLSEARRLRVLAYDPRPSWGSSFVRRELEADPGFTVETLVRSSRGLKVRTGAPPDSLTSGALDAIDLVLVGAPEDLARSEVEALRTFVARRGGAVAFVPDRRPTGDYLPLLGAVTFDELLLERPVRVTSGDGPSLRGSELVVPRSVDAGGQVLATIPQSGAARAAVVEWPLGAGRILFSGVLDAWRFRGDDDGEFGAFWRARLASAAARSPRRLELRVEPGVAASGETVLVSATLRASELSTAGGRLTVPAVSAELIDSNGATRPLRLWPSSRPGVYEGHLRAGAPGHYDIRVRGEKEVTADAPLIVSATQARNPSEGAATASRLTGGVVVDGSDLSPVVEQLRSLAPESALRTVHPARSAWWTVAFAVLLGSEWFARRRSALQ